MLWSQDASLAALDVRFSDAFSHACVDPSGADGDASNAYALPQLIRDAVDISSESVLASGIDGGMGHSPEACCATDMHEQSVPLRMPRIAARIGTCPDVLRGAGDVDDAREVDEQGAMHASLVRDAGEVERCDEGVARVRVCKRGAHGRVRGDIHAVVDEMRVRIGGSQLHEKGGRRGDGG